MTMEDRWCTWQRPPVRRRH